MHRVKNGAEKKEGDTVSQSSSKQRRKIYSDRPRQPNGYLQEWVHQSRSYLTPATQYDPQYSQVVGPYWEVASSPRMFAAFSDPSVCRYSVPTAPPTPMAYSYEPVSLPIYQPTYQPAVPPSPLGSWRSPQHVSHQRHLNHGAGKKSKRSNGSLLSKLSPRTPARNNATTNSSPLQYVQSTPTQEEYLSLPPGTQPGCDLDDSHRRFSDPGLARAEPESVPVANEASNLANNNLEDGNESGDWTQDSSSCSPASGTYESLALSEQVNLLKAENQRLSQELREARAEVHKLKLQAATWGSPVQQDYQPGMIADLVREIRDAAQLREETLLARLRHMMADGGVLRLSGSNDRETPVPLHSRDTNANSLESQMRDDFRDSERITRLERQLNSLQLHNGHDGSRREEQLRRELQEAQAARKMAESNVNKLEKLMNMMRKKMNGVTSTGGPGGAGAADREGEGETQPLAASAPSAPSSPALSSLEFLSLTSACTASATATAPGCSPPGPVTDL